MSQIRVNLVGQRYGQLTVMEMVYLVGKAARCSVKCDCGTIKEVNCYDIQRNSTKSCGCLRKKLLDKTTHGLKRHRAYAIWHAMHSRCYEPTNPDFINYGARGIQVDYSWYKGNPAGLKNFVAWFDSKNPAPDLSVDRENNDGNYEPGNCRFATAKEQAANTRPKRKRKL